MADGMCGVSSACALDDGPGVCPTTNVTQAKQKSMEDLTSGQAATLLRNERQCDRAREEIEELEEMLLESLTWVLDISGFGLHEDEQMLPRQAISLAVRHPGVLMLIVSRDSIRAKTGTAASSSKRGLGNEKRSFKKSSDGGKSFIFDTLNHHEGLQPWLRTFYSFPNNLSSPQNTEDSCMEDDDDDGMVYDRTKKKESQKRRKRSASQEVLDAATLLARKSLLAKDLELVERQLQEETKRVTALQASHGQPEIPSVAEADTLDSFMEGVDSRLETDKVASLETRLQELLGELDRTQKLLRIADPDGYDICEGYVVVVFSFDTKVRWVRCCKQKEASEVVSCLSNWPQAVFIGIASCQGGYSASNPEAGDGKGKQEENEGPTASNRIR